MNKTNKRVNTELFDKCKDILGLKAHGVILVLLEAWEAGEIIIKETHPVIESEEFKHVGMYVDSLILMSLTLEIEKRSSKQVKGYDILNILMYNFLN